MVIQQLKALVFAFVHFHVFVYLYQADSSDTNRLSV